MHSIHHSPGIGIIADPTAADILRGAALYLTRHGWHQGHYYAATPGPFPPACALGAIAIAAYGQRVTEPFDTDRPEQPLFVRAVDALADHLEFTEPADTPDASYWLDPDDIHDWNDTPGHTAEQVIAALTDAADAYDRAHAALPVAGAQ